MTKQPTIIQTIFTSYCGVFEYSLLPYVKGNSCHPSSKLPSELSMYDFQVSPVVLSSKRVNPLDEYIWYFSCSKLGSVFEMLRLILSGTVNFILSGKFICCGEDVLLSQPIIK